MKPILTNLHPKIRAFCKPDPKAYPDPSAQEIAWDRNLINFYGLAGAIMTFVTFSLYFKLSFFVFLAVFIPAICGFLCFCTVRRSKFWIYYVFYSFASFVGEWIALETVQETVYYHIGHAFLFVTLVFILTGELWLTCVSVILQIFLMMTRFKEKLAILLLAEEPTVFAEKLVGNVMLAIAILLVVSVALTKILEKKTIELSKAKIALENALDQQKTFIFSFSHELRNPINSLLGNLQLVLEGGEVLSPKAREMINIAKVCGELLLHNINNVLDTGKYDIGKLEVNPMPTQLHELFQGTWGIYSELFRQKKLKSQLRIEKDLPPVVKIDSHKVNQILLNLIGNSIKFTEKGSVSVTVKWLKSSTISEECFEPIPYDETDEGLFEKEENIRRFSESIQELPDEGRHHPNEIHQISQQESKGILKIIVKDTGSGMKPEALEKLFKKFSQVSENIAQRHIGTGLGLFITKEICNAMGGEIRAYSKFNTGTTFVACIPTVSVPMTHVHRVDSAFILQHLSAKYINTIVADDSPFNVNLICDYFAKFGAHVASVAYNGYEAFMKYKELKANPTDIDIVVLDIDMPILDGRKACDRIRDYERENALKPAFIILISGNYDQEQIKNYLDSEKGHKADCFLRKPISFSEFHRTVYSLFIQE